MAAIRSKNLRQEALPLYKSPPQYLHFRNPISIPSSSSSFIDSKFHQSPSQIQSNPESILMMPMLEIDAGDIFVKIAIFVLVQILVYFILSKSSNLFSKDEKLRSLSFKPARSVSIRRFLAALSDLPPGGELSPSSRVPTPSSVRRDRSDDGGRF